MMVAGQVNSSKIQMMCQLYSGQPSTYLKNVPKKEGQSVCSFLLRCIFCQNTFWQILLRKDAKTLIYQKQAALSALCWRLLRQIQTHFENGKCLFQMSALFLRLLKAFVIRIGQMKVDKTSIVWYRPNSFLFSDKKLGKKSRSSRDNGHQTNK